MSVQGGDDHRSDIVRHVIRLIFDVRFESEQPEKACDVIARIARRGPDQGLNESEFAAWPYGVLLPGRRRKRRPRECLSSRLTLLL